MLSRQFGVLLAALLARQPMRLGEARRVGEEALAVTQDMPNLATSEVWSVYGILAASLRELAAESNELHRTSLQIQVFQYRQFSDMPLRLHLSHLRVSVARRLSPEP